MGILRAVIAYDEDRAMLNLNDTQQIKSLPSLLRSYDFGDRVCRLYHHGKTFEIWVLRDGVLCGKLLFTRYVEPDQYGAIIYTPEDGLLYRVWKPEPHAVSEDFQAACVLAMSAYGDIDRNTTQYWEGLCSIVLVTPSLVVVHIDDREVIAFTTGDNSMRLIDVNPMRWAFRPVHDFMYDGPTNETIDQLADHLYNYLHKLLPTETVKYH